jgi:flavin-dependent dehydrogenase
MKAVADDMMEEYGVKCLLHTWAADVIMEGNTLKGVIIENVDGRQAIMAKTVIDCTGNGVIFEKAGAPYIMPKEMQPMTIGFFLAEVEPNTFIDRLEEMWTWTDLN